MYDLPGHRLWTLSHCCSTHMGCSPRQQSGSSTRAHTGCSHPQLYVGDRNIFHWSCHICRCLCHQDDSYMLCNIEICNCAYVREWVNMTSLCWHRFPLVASPKNSGWRQRNPKVLFWQFKHWPVVMLQARPSDESIPLQSHSCNTLLLWNRIN